jgi:flagellar basal body-associated protein FliL
MKKFLIVLIIVVILISCLIWIFFKVPFISSNRVPDSKKYEEQKQKEKQDPMLGLVQVGGSLRDITAFEFVKYSLQVYKENLNYK